MQWDMQQRVVTVKISALESKSLNYSQPGASLIPCLSVVRRSFIGPPQHLNGFTKPGAFQQLTLFTKEQSLTKS